MEENKLNTQSVEFEYGNKTVKIETGKIARQATSSIIVTMMLDVACLAIFPVSIFTVLFPYSNSTD